MNTTIRNLIVALPLAAAAVTMAPSVALADTGDITQPLPGGDPQGPVIANPTPNPTPNPTGPGDLTAPQPCPTHGVDCGGNGGKGGNGGGDHGTGDDDGGTKVHHGGGLHPKTHVESIALPTRIDAGLAPAQPEHDGLELTWLLASGALVTASGAAFAARRVRARA
jgi:hypothetical protein